MIWTENVDVNLYAHNLNRFLHHLWLHFNEDGNQKLILFVDDRWALVRSCLFPWKHHRTPFRWEGRISAKEKFSDQVVDPQVVWLQICGGFILQIYLNWLSKCFRSKRIQNIHKDYSTHYSVKHSWCVKVHFAPSLLLLIKMNHTLIWFKSLAHSEISHYGNK